MLHILAAFIFFTRLPFWRLAEVPSEYFKNVVSRWALVGWLTAGFSVIVLYATSLVLPTSVAVLLAIVTRLLITGCLHEDGLADFFDGFGGGTSRERILSIMKDSPYRKLRSDRVDSLFCASIYVIEQPATGSCRKCDTGRRSFFQRSCRNDH